MIKQLRPFLNICGRKWMQLFNGFLSLPYSVSIQSHKWGFRFPFCGGALVSENWVITSAICASLTEKPKIVLGEHNLDRTDGNEKL